MLLATAIKIAEALLRAPEVEFVPCADFFGRTLETFRTQAGTKLSFTDSAVATIATERAGGMVATFDAEFRKLSGITVVSA